MSLFTRLLLIIVVALLPSLAMQAFNEAALRSAREADVRDEAMREARGVSAGLERITDGVRNTLVALAEVPAVRNGEPAECAGVLRAVKARFVFLRQIALIGAAGRPRCGSTDEPPRDRSAEVQVQLAQERHDFALGTYARDATGRPVLPMAYPVHGVPGAMLLADFDLDWLRDRLANQLPPAATLAVADRNGTFLLRLPDSALIGSSMRQDRRWILTEPGPGAIESVGRDGVRRIVGYVPLATAPSDLFVSVGFSTDTIYAASEAAARRGYLLIAAGLLAALALAGWMVRGTITRPVRAILATTERWQAGDTSARVPLSASPRSEFGRIAAAVNVMLDAVAAGQAGLQRANAELERRVLDRTAQLRAEVAEREAAQAQLLQAQKMEMLGQLTGGVAHDFNNLLTAIVGNIELALGRSANQPEVERLLHAGLRAADRGAALTQRMLAFGRRQYLRSEPVAIAPLLEGMADLLARTIAPPVTVRIDVAPGLCPAHADPNQVELLVLNLAVNARDAMPEGGTIIIAAAEEAVFGEGNHRARIVPGRYVRITVTDTGSGMDAATAARAFEPFFTTKPVGRGSGLGLSMVQGVAEQSGGGVAIESAPGRGTSVSVWLPCGAADAAGPAPEPAAERAAERLLLIDDDAEVRAATAATLDAGGYDVVEAEGGETALALLRSGFRPGLLIVDLNLQGMDGAAVIAEARRIAPGVPALLATGYGDAAAKFGYPVLAKPFRAADLYAQVAALLRPAA